MVPDIFLLWTGEYPTGLQADLLQVPAVDFWQQAPAGTSAAGLALQIKVIYLDGIAQTGD